MKPLDLVGKKFGRLTAIKRVGTQNGHVTWLCKCDCGNETVVSASTLKSGYTKSCGCLWKDSIYEFNHSERRKETTRKAKTKHGMKGTRIYRILQAMRQRCRNSNVPCFKYYGGRGIAVCDEWEKSFQSFYDWSIANGYSDELTIDRIDVNGNYEPSNCRWVSMAEQNKNKRRNKNGIKVETSNIS